MTSLRRGRCYRVDLPDWPEEIEVKGGIVKLAPVTLRMAEEIDVESPASGEAIDLSTTEIRWTSLPKAAFYRIHISVRKETPRPKSEMFLPLDIEYATASFHRH